MSKKIIDLDVMVRAKAQKAWEDMQKNEQLKKLGVEEIAINETRRELAVQMAYYARGRMSVPDVKRMYAAAGLYAISDVEAMTVNTNTLNSNHIYGRAIDFVPVREGRLWWTAPKEVWELMGSIGENAGLKWGGRWKDFQDCPHFEL